MNEFNKKYFEECVAKIMMNIDTEDYAIDLLQEVYGTDAIVGEVLDLAINCIEDNKEINTKNLLYYMTYTCIFINENDIEKWFDGYCIMLVDM